MRQDTIGLLHPGEMGAAVGSCLARRGVRVLWAPAGRSPDTAERARAAGLTDTGTIAGLAAQAPVILSVCPPHAALTVARSVTAAGWPASAAETGAAGDGASSGGVYVDANAVSPATAREIARVIEEAGGSYVDGGIIGGPPTAPGDARLYLSGPRAGEIAALFAGTPLEARVIGADAGAASALKMAYAAWTKGTAALLLAARALACAEDVEDALLAEWEQSQPALVGRSQAAAVSATGKGWRWAGEMEEIAASMTAAGLPDGFHQAAAEIFRRSPHTPAPTGVLTNVIHALLASDHSTG